MTETKRADEQEKKWITVQGRRIEIGEGENIKDKLQSDLRGEKEKNTKEALKKSLVRRFNLQKSKFSFRDEVVYDEFNKTGTVGGFEGNYVKIFSKGNAVVRPKNEVFKKSELIGDFHWDVYSVDHRRDILMKSGISQNYVKHDWARLPAIIQDQIMKDGTPAGTGITSNTSGVWNPVNSDKTVDSKLKEAEAKSDERKKRD